MSTLWAFDLSTFTSVWNLIWDGFWLLIGICIASNILSFLRIIGGAIIDRLGDWWEGKNGH